MSQPPDFTGLKVMINPGHGGYDSDDRGMPNGFWESESNLTKGLWLRDLLQARGCEVVMSRVLNRTEDDLPLSQIAQIANENDVDLFISIHSNAGDQRTNYCMTIFNGKSETPAIPAAKVWARILWEQLLTNEATFWTSTSPHYIGDLTLNPSWAYGYGVLYPLEVPGIISEGSMHDYRPEMDRLLNLEYRKQEAWNIMYAMQEYFQLPGTEEFGVIAGIIRDSLLIKDSYNIPGSPDKFEVVNKAEVEILESGEKYFVDSLNTGYYYFDSIAPGTYNLVFSAKDYFSDTVMVNVMANQIRYHNHWMEADKTMAPKIVNLNPSEGDTISCNDPVRIAFNMNMDSASVARAISIEPAIEGYVSWDEDYLSALFFPVLPYDTSTHYTLKIDTLAMHQWGVKLDSATELSFFTGNRNRYKLEKSFPTDQQNEVSPFLQFRLYFDAPVDNSSLINAVFIKKENGELIGTKGATIYEIDGKGHYYFSPATDLEFSTQYTLVIYGSVKDEQNIPLVDTLKIPFTTDEDPGLITVLNEFEDLKTWSIDFVNSNSLDPSSFLYKWSKTYRSGSASTLLRYKFNDPLSECLLVPLTPIAVEYIAGKIAMWIWGDMSRNEIYLQFDYETEVLLTEIDFAGWKYCSIDLEDEVSELTGIRMKKTSQGSDMGDLYFDALSQPDNTGFIIPSVGDLKIFPNPLKGNTLNITGLPEGNSSYSVVTMKGQILQTGKVSSTNNTIELKENKGSHSFLILNIVHEKISYSAIIKRIN
jgi:hypothetical protein